MKHGQISRNSAKAFFAFVTLALVSACADNAPMAPTAEAPAFVAPANFTKSGYVVAFRVDNSQGATQRIGQHVINIPAGAICDLTTSGYGADFWQKSCKPLKGSIVITATVLEGPNGEPYIDFQPAMRFAPNKEVTLFFRDNQMDTKSVSIKYCNNLGYCVDESLNDASLKPFRISKNIVGRRLGHFSGYVVAYDECPPMGCDTGMTRRSGYMVASGDDVKDMMGPGQDETPKGGKSEE